MHSLTTHLRAGDAHDSLPFHTSCPICRERRLHGDIVLASVLPVRTQAALVATVIAVGGTGMPVAAIAAEHDSIDDGTAQVSATAPADPATSSDYDPGGADDALPPQAPPTPAPTPAAVDDGPADAAPTTDESDPVVDSGDGQADATTAAPTTSAAPVPTPAATTLPPAAPVPPAAPTDETTAPPAAAPAPQSPVPAEAAPAPPRAAKTTTASAHTRSRHKSQPQTAARQIVPVAAPTAATVPVPVAAATTTQPVSSPAHVAVSSSDATHVVRPGESLWAIAASLVGPRATPAVIAREVHHLWSLNAQRIGTGNPDLLMVGTRLQLR